MILRGILIPRFRVGGGYTLTIGASHTEGKEVANGKRYSDILNTLLGGTENNVTVYNLSKDGFYFPGIAKHFTAITSEFPDSETIIIEIGRTDFSVSNLLDALEQTEYDETQNGDQILSSLSPFVKLKSIVKANVPFLTLAKKQLKLIVTKDTGEVSEETGIVDYENALDSVCSMLDQIYDGRILIVYHPTVTIEADGTMEIDLTETDAIFARVCENNGIEFVDMTDSFLAAYEEDFLVPYGFNNTSIGSGHLNSTGHRLIAEKLYEVLGGGR